MKNRNLMITLLAVALIGAGATISFKTGAFAPLHQANGQGSLPSVNDNGQTVKRQFSFSARQLDEAGNAEGNAVLHNPAFTGTNGKAPYQLQIDIKCLKVINGNTALVGGNTRRTNDPSLIDAVYFVAVDNGEPGKGKDLLSRAFFFDDNPGTHGDPMLCTGINPADFAPEPIESGNIQVR